MSLTFAGPHGSDHVMLHTEDDRGHDHGRQGRLGDEGAERHQEGEADDHQQPGVDSAESRPHPAGAVHSGSGEMNCDEKNLKK